MQPMQAPRHAYQVTYTILITLKRFIIVNPQHYM
eukprot:gene2527-1582_t